MALRALKCPSCGANLELDDSREFGFCEYCGAKVQIREVIEIRHKIDNSEQLSNLKTLADREYNSRNYIEAYNHYKNALEYNANDSICLYRSAICNIYNSKERIALAEFYNDVNMAKNYIPENEKDALEKQIEKELMHLFNNLPVRVNTEIKIYSSALLCEQQILSLIGYLSIAKTINSLLIDDYDKEELLKKAIDVCDTKIYTKLKYGDQKNKKAQTDYKTSPSNISTIETLRKELSELYNNLPHRAQEYNNAKEELDALTTEVSLLKNELKNLKGVKNSNGIKHKEFNGLPIMLIGLIIGICMAIFFAYMLFSGAISSDTGEYSKEYEMMTNIMFISLPVVISLLISFFVLRDKKKKFYASLNFADENSEYDRAYNKKILYYKKVIELEESRKRYDKIRREQK